MNADWPSARSKTATKRSSRYSVCVGVDVAREPREAVDRAAVDQRRIVDLEPGGQPVDDQQVRVARLRLRHLQRHDDALVLGEAFQVDLGSVELVERPLDRIAVRRGGLGRDRRAGDRGHELSRCSGRRWRWSTGLPASAAPLQRRLTAPLTGCAVDAELAEARRVRRAPRRRAPSRSSPACWCRSARRAPPRRGAGARRWRRRRLRRRRDWPRRAARARAAASRRREP